MTSIHIHGREQMLHAVTTCVCLPPRGKGLRGAHVLLETRERTQPQSCASVLGGWEVGGCSQDSASRGRQVSQELRDARRVPGAGGGGAQGRGPLPSFPPCPRRWTACQLGLSNDLCYSNTVLPRGPHQTSRPGLACPTTWFGRWVRRESVFTSDAGVRRQHLGNVRPVVQGCSATLPAPRGPAQPFGPAGLPSTPASRPG